MFDGRLYNYNLLTETGRYHKYLLLQKDSHAIYTIIMQITQIKLCIRDIKLKNELIRQKPRYNLKTNAVCLS